MELVYVHNLPVFTINEAIRKEKVALIKSLFEVENMWPISKLLGSQFDMDGDVIKIHCEKYVEKCFERFNFKSFTKISLLLQHGVVPSRKDMPDNENLKEDAPYKNLLGCLLYISDHCGSDNSYEVATLSQFVENPDPIHWKCLQ